MEQLCIKNPAIQKTVKNCVFTGHRELPENFPLNTLEAEIRRAIGLGAEVFYNGVSYGFDLAAAEIVIRLKREFPSIKLIACVPFYGQEKNFSESDKKRYVEVLKNADEKVVLAEHYFRGCALIRDRYMAERADMMIAYCVKEKGGTAYTVKAFKKCNKYGEIVFINCDS